MEDNQNQLKDELKYLKVIKKAVNVKKHRNEVNKLTVLIDEIVDSIRNKELKFYINSVSEKQLVHVQYYKARASQNKNKALTDLQELKQELNRNGKASLKRVNVLLDNLTGSEFYSVSTENFLGSWRNNTTRPFKRQYFTV